MGFNKQGAKNRVSVTKKRGSLAFSLLNNNVPDFCTQLFGTNILDLFSRVTNRPMFLKQE